MDEDFPLELLGGDLEVAERFDGDDELKLRFRRKTERAWLSRSEVERLRDHLTALLGDGAQPSGDRPVELVVGREYRLLPDSKYVAGPESMFTEAGTTRVRLMKVRADGDVMCAALDGTESGLVAHVDRCYLAPLDPLARPLAEVLTGKASAADVAQAAREVSDWFGLSGTDTHDAIEHAFRRFAEKLEGSSK